MKELEAWHRMTDDKVIWLGTLQHYLARRNHQTRMLYENWDYMAKSTKEMLRTYVKEQSHSGRNLGDDATKNDRYLQERY
jgi:hypothetical protein